MRIRLIVCASVWSAVAGATWPWTHLCDNCAAVGDDCPFIDHGDDSSLSACQASCQAEAGCNAINVDPSIQDCVLRACVNPAKVNATPDDGYSVYTLPTRPTPPPGCYSRSSQRRTRLRAATTLSDAQPPSSWVADIERIDKLWTPDDSALDPQYDMPQLGNGFLATQVMTDSVFVSGLYNGLGTTTPSHRARIPSSLAVSAPGQTTAAAWDVRRATYYRRSFIAPGGGCTIESNVSCTTAPAGVTVEQRLYAHRLLPSLLIMEVEVLGGNDGGQSVSEERAGAPPLAVLHLVSCPSSDSTDIAFTSVPLPPGAPYAIANGSTLLPETNTSGTQGVAVLTSAWPARGMLAVAGRGQTHVFMMVVRTTVETPAGELVDGVAADFSLAQSYIEAGTLHSSHVAAWEGGPWVAGVEVTGRPDIARVVNASFAALIGSIREDRPYSPAPTGLSGAGNSQTGYNGHIFWDADTWMGPPLFLLHPDLGGAMVQYRLNGLPGARAKAASYSPAYTGAAFPWESARTGYETCPSWASTGTSEVHISGDVAVAAWWLYRTTQQINASWLQDVGYPLLGGIADFWVSRTVPSLSGGGVSIFNVIPPDEYAFCNNSAYTNAVAKVALNAAAAAAAILGEPPSTYAAWLQTSAALSIPFNATVPGFPGGVHPEYDGYLDAQIKQADVVLLGFPLMVTFGNAMPATRRNDLNYYYPLTDPGGPAMTWAMHSVGFAELGEVDKAGALLNQSMLNAQTSPFALWTETTSGGAPNFITGAGGFLQAAIYGYPRLRLNDSAFTFTAPMLPDGASHYKLRGVAYLGNRLDVSYDSDSIVFEVQQQADAGMDGGCAPQGEAAQRRQYALHDAAWARARRTATAAYAPGAACQRGRVFMRGAPITPTPLVVVAEGVSYALKPGVPVHLPIASNVTTFTVTASAHEGPSDSLMRDLPLAAAGRRLTRELRASAFDVGSW